MLRPTPNNARNHSMLQVLDATCTLQHCELESGTLSGQILAPKIAPKPLQLPKQNRSKNNKVIEQPKQELARTDTGGGVPLEQQTTTHRKDGRVTPCVAYGPVADF